MPSATAYRSRRPEVSEPLDRVRRLDAMGSSRRRAQFEAGALSRAELFAWAGRYPEEVPLVNGELPWIAMRLADLD